MKRAQNIVPNAGDSTDKPFITLKVTSMENLNNTLNIAEVDINLNQNIQNYKFLSSKEFYRIEILEIDNERRRK